MKRLTPLFLLALVGCNSATDTTKTTPTTEPTKAPEATETKAPEKADWIGEQSSLADKVPVDGEEIGVIDTKFGKILLRFYRDKAPNHVANFKKLAMTKLYDGTKFHRIDPNFMIQGGDPNSKDDDPSNDGMGGPGHNVKAEFNDISHVRGILSMARSQDPDSAGSQFFLVVKDSFFLDTQYTVFGRICKDGTEKGEDPAGFAVMDKIANGPLEGKDKAKDPVVMNVKIAKWPLK